jgi:hypothetical protein
MKNPALLSWVIFTAISCNSQNSGHSGSKSNGLALANLKGKVSRMQKTLHQVKNSTCPAAGCGNIKQQITLYNEKGNSVESYSINENGDTAFISKYFYNRHNQCKEIDKYNRNVLIGKEVNTFEGNKLLEVKIYNEYGESGNVNHYEYSGDELLGGKVLNDKGDLISSFQNKYAGGQIDTLIERDMNGEVSTITKYFRNKDQDVIASTVYYPKIKEEIKVMFEYEFDRAGNWTRQTQRFNGDIVQIIIRNISYYND